jgi:hypothetical protein
VRGQHIAEMVTELNVLSRFRRANHGRIFEGDTAALVEQTNAYYETARRTLKSLSSKSGYNTYFETWDPEQVTEEEMVIEGLKHLFITQTLDQRIEEALPILARIQQQGTEMKEANIFEAWARQLVEGTWATPDTPEKRATLAQLMSAEFPVGPDATNATEQLYDILGDDVLVDRLETLSTQDPDADARQIIYDRMQELADHPDVRAAMSEFTMDQQTPTAEPVAEIKDPADQTEDPADTKQPEYPEYQDDLADILKNAGVDDTVVRAAPDYEDEITDEGAAAQSIGDKIGTGLGTVSGAVAGGMLGGAPGMIGGAVAGNLAGGAIGSKIGAAVEEEETDEGWKGQLAGGTLGGIGGTLAGGAAGGPIGALVGGSFGGTAGQMIGDKLGGDDEETLEEGGCNMTEAGEMCPQHGMTECGTDGQDNSPLAGQYGHSGKMKPVEKDVSFLNRLKELSGMMRK